MESTELVASYRQALEQMLAKVAPISAQINEWTASHLTSQPGVYDVAAFQVLRAQRSKYLSEFEDYENEFVLALLNSISSMPVERRA